MRHPSRGGAKGLGGWLLAAALACSAHAATVKATAPDDPAPAAPAASAAGAYGHWVGAYAVFGETPKYPPGFDHFDYVNPAAPKGGTLYLANPDRRTSFDKFNFFTVRGNVAVGIPIYMLESLAVTSADEPKSMYGLLAEAMMIEPDRSAITFRLNPKARFSNGDPVTTEDVKFSFDTLTGKYVRPDFNSDYAGVARAVVLDARTIRFELKEKSDDTLFKLGRLYVFSHKWGLQPDGSHKRFDDIVTEYPLTTGAYTIALADNGRRIEFQRNPDYWARDLPVRRGFFNFDRIVYRYYKDDVVATEAFKAGEYDINKVYSASIWMRQHRGAKWDDGRIVKNPFPSGTGQGLQSFQLNLRRPIFQDVRVREALNLSYDFETRNRYHLFKRANSLFNNSDFAAEGLPSAGELKLLEPYRDQLPKQVFGPAFEAPRNDADPNALRRNLLRARDLLAAAGWKLAPDGVLRNPKGERFEIEYLAPSGQDTDATMNPWRHNLDKLGITIRDRKVDFALFNRRLETFDFDMVTIVEASFSLPSASDFLSYYGSKAAGDEGSNNYGGIKSPAVDRVLQAMATAESMQQFRDACRALDRIVMWQFYQVAELYGDTDNASYWNRFGIPAVLPKYFSIDQAPDVDLLLPWPITTWWAKSAGPH